MSTRAALGTGRVGAIAVALLAGATSCAQPHGLAWSLEYEGARPLVAAHLLEIRAGGCTGGSVLYRAELHRFDDTPMDVPPLSAGPFGFFAEARDTDCNVVATGCTDVVLPSAEATVVTVLRTVAGTARCEAARCDDGVCAGTDAGLTDAGSRDARGPDAPLPDAPLPDAPGLDAALPDAAVADAAVADAFVAPDDVFVPPDACDPATLELCNGRDDNCNGSVDETFDLSTDTSNCGRCGNVCPDRANATTTCVGGTCGFTCQPDYGDCDGTEITGCERALNTTTSCGTCTRICSGATPMCGTSMGVTTCVSGCAATEVRCIGTCTNTDTDPLNCGGCGNRCSLTRATAGCAGGMCTVASCNANYGDCDGNPANGCETDLRTSAAHCGTCPNACPTCNSCSAGVCGLASELSACTGGRCVGGACCMGCTSSVAGVQMCYPGDVDTACGNNGASCTNCGRCATCVGNACTPITDGSACMGAGAAGTCHAGACCTGCWNGTSCQVGSATTACGTAGIDCASCSCFCGTTSMCEVNGTAFRMIDAGYTHSCVISRNQVYCWGDNTDGELGIGALGGRYDTPRIVMAGSFTSGSGTLSLGEHHSVSSGITSDTYGWGQNTHAQVGTGAAGAAIASPVVTNASSSVNVRAGGSHACWISGSSLQCWGLDDFGQVGNGVAGADVLTASTVPGLSSLTSSSSFSLGHQHTCITNLSRQLFCWGRNDTGQLGVGNTTSPVLVATRESTSGTTWVAVDAGRAHTCARTSTGTLFCWGDNSAGQLGLGDGTDRDAPTQVGTATTWASVSAGGHHTCAVRTSGQLWCWGANDHGQLGDGTRTPRDAPVRIGTANDWTEVSAGDNHTCGIRADGVYCWGDNTAGQAGLGAAADATSPTRLCGF